MSKDLYVQVDNFILSNLSEVVVLYVFPYGNLIEFMKVYGGCRHLVIMELGDVCLSWWQSALGTRQVEILLPDSESSYWQCDMEWGKAGEMLC